MIGQSLAIAAVILVMVFMFLRAKKKAAAILALPLISVPAAYLLGRVIYSGSLGTGAIGFMVGGLVVDVLVCSLLAHSIPSRRARWTYLGIATLFPALLTVSYLMQLL